MFFSILESLLVRHLIWKGAFFVSSLERVLCPLEFETQIRIWTLWRGRASPTSRSILSTATWECVLEKRKHPNFKECTIRTAFASVTEGNVHRRALKGELRCPFSDPYTLLFSLQTFPLVWLSEIYCLFLLLQGFWHFPFSWVTVYTALKAYRCQWLSQNLSVLE